MTDQSISKEATLEAAPTRPLAEQDRLRLRRALELADGGRGRVSPNPLVGAVVVRDDEIIGEGFHAELGGLHAERAALEACRRAGEDPRGATLYVTVEPCAHHGRQPPCTEAIVEAGIARVVIGCEDPDERAGGRGPGILRDEGIDVTFADGAEAAAARLLNQPHRKLARTGRPLVTLKSALTLDGRTATVGGDSRWISGSQSRALAHRWRAEVDGVVVGIGTALADDPLLTARDVDPPAPRQPRRIVFDSRARLPLSSRLVETLEEAPLTLVVSAEAPAERTDRLRAAGVDVIGTTGDAPARVRAALDDLGRRELAWLLLEGGPALAGAFLDAGEVDELRLFVAPVVVGGAEARPVAGGSGIARIVDAARALSMSWESSGEDLLIRARLREW